MSASHVEAAVAFVTAKVPAAELVESFAGALHFRVAKEQLVASAVFRAFMMERPRTIVDWGLSMATLEDVFLNIARADEMASPL